MTDPNLEKRRLRVARRLAIEADRLSNFLDNLPPELRLRKNFRAFIQTLINYRDTPPPKPKPEFKPWRWGRWTS